jgi:pimeloyl-ACP methyl ester carboxylesterase
MNHTIEENITFLSDGFQLSGTLHRPDGVPSLLVIGSHGLLSNGDSPKQIRLGRECNRKGMAYLRFDHRGCGQSAGDFVDVTSLESRHNDILNAIKWMRKRFDTNRIGLFGSSLGGAAALSVAGTHQVDALVTLAAPVTGASILESADADADLKGLPVSFYEKCLHFTIAEKLPFISNALIFHGDADTVVPVSNSHEIKKKIKDPKRLIIQKNGDHRMSNPTHQADFYKMAVEWFSNT